MTSPQVDIRKEVRLAVVMYGGVSLAIYINGVAQELLHLVRATAPDPTDSTRPRVSAPSGTEAVYRKLAQMLRPCGPPALDAAPDDPITTRFVIDVISGTSAGGINGVYLAKALANGQSIDGLKDLWIQEGNIERLINDAESVRDLPGARLTGRPKSLLNSDRMYRKLFDAFESMETAASSAPYVDEVDLFVTSTDVRGLTVPLRLVDTVVPEKRHRHFFHFRFRDQAVGDPCHQFGRDYNRFLAFVCRCTSAFPVAFEPMKLTDAPGVFDGAPWTSEEWRGFFTPYVGPEMKLEDARPALEKICFGDGGYLDNKPFSYATEMLARRRSDLSVDRKLLYVEPSPEDLDLDWQSDRRGVSGPSKRDGDGPPNALENASIALSLARYETIRDDLDRVLARNRLIERVERIVSGMESDVASGLRELPRTRAEFADLDLPTRIRREGVAYGGYFRLKVAALTDEIAELITRVAGFDRDTDEFVAIQYLVRAWRDRSFGYTVEEKDDRSSPATPPVRRRLMTEFLVNFDFPYRIRRLDFLLTKIDELRCLDDRAKRVLGYRRVEVPAEPTERAAFTAELRRLAIGLRRLQIELMRQRDRVRARVGTTPVHAAFQNVTLGREELVALLKLPDDASRLVAAASIIDREGQGFVDLARALETYVSTTTDENSKQCRSLLGIQDDDQTGSASPPSGWRGADGARHAIAHYWVAFEQYDMISYPILYSTDVGSELDAVEVARISPLDATSLIDECRSTRRKLGGTALMHFGAFLDRGWRWNDILWGRLDGAERLISILYTGPPSVRDALIKEAQLAILSESFATQNDAAFCKLLADALAKGEPANASDQALLTRLTEPKASAPVNALFQAALVTCLQDPAKIRDHFATAYEVHRDIDRETALQTLSRSSQVVGHMLDGIAKDAEVDTGKSGVWFARLSRVFWGLVQVSVPGSLAEAFFRHWLSLLYIFEVLLVVAGLAFGSAETQRTGLICFAATAALHLGAALLNEYMSRGHRRTRAVIAVLAIIVVALAVLGAWQLPTVVHGVAANAR